MKVKIENKDIKEKYLICNDGYVCDGNYAIAIEYVKFTDKKLEELRKTGKKFKYTVDTKELEVDNVPSLSCVLEVEDSYKYYKPTKLIDTKCSYNMYDEDDSSYHIFVVDNGYYNVYVYMKEKYYRVLSQLLKEDISIELYGTGRIAYKNKDDDIIGLTTRAYSTEVEDSYFENLVKYNEEELEFEKRRVKAMQV